MTRICELCDQPATVLATKGKTNDRCENHINKAARLARKKAKTPAPTDAQLQAVEITIDTILSARVHRSARKGLAQVVSTLEKSFGLPPHRFE